MSPITSPLGKLKSLFTADGAGSSGDVRDEVAAARAAHEAEEARADNLIHEREVEESREAPFVDPEDVVPSGLSTLKPRASLKLAARPPPYYKGKAEDEAVHTLSPDLDGATRIPESMLPQRHERTEHTALRPSDPMDPNSMDGAPEPSTAGDDSAI